MWKLLLTGLAAVTIAERTLYRQSVESLLADRELIAAAMRPNLSLVSQ